MIESFESILSIIINSNIIITNTSFSVPLLMAYITRYIFGTDKLRPNAFEVRGMNGSNTGVIQCSDLAVLSNWIKLISDYISILNSQKVIIIIYQDKRQTV